MKCAWRRQAVHFHRSSSARKRRSLTQGFEKSPRVYQQNPCIMKHNYFALLLMALVGTTGLAQEVNVAIELVYQDDGSIAGYPAGFNTWRIYAELEEADDFLSAIYATTESAQLSITTSTNQIWNHADGGVTPTSISSGDIAADPAVGYDSWVTIGAEDNSEASIVTYLSLLPSLTAFQEAFGTDGSDAMNPNLAVNDGALFTLLDAANGYAEGPDNRVLIGQVTTDGDISVCMNFQIFPDGVNGEMTEYDNYCEEAFVPLSVEETAVQPATLFPNPAEDEVTLRLDPTAGPAQVVVRNLTGQQVWQGTATQSQTELPVATLPDGLYLIEVSYTTLNLRETRRLVLR